LVWFQLVAQARDWGRAGAILDEAQKHLGETPAILVSRLFTAVESQDNCTAADLITRTAGIRGDVTSLCRIRHALRRGDAKSAVAEALLMIDSPSAGLYWPYLSLAWRLQGDARHLWLDDPERFIQQSEIGMSAADLAELAEVLSGLHTMPQPYLEQTVRGGTQTDRSVLLRHEPILQRTRAAWMDVIRDHVAALPAAQQGHPFLGTARGHLLLNGSWSVKLRPGGHNVPHSHPMGWLSSSLYVTAPAAEPAPAGHIAFGAPPPELGLDLPAYRTIAPQPGKVVTFPSTLWHSVVPFGAGQRLMIALDVRKPDY
jgi:Putative 2OG-Fe(II) oxygenase